MRINYCFYFLSYRGCLVLKKVDYKTIVNNENKVHRVPLKQVQ